MPDYMQDSLELNLFYLRIMKEHALFLMLGFTPKNKDLSDQAAGYKKRLNELLNQAVEMAKGFISPAIMSSGELFTRYTEEAERQTQYDTGVPIDTRLTVDEYDVGGRAVPPPSMQPQIDDLNDAALALTYELLRFKEQVRDDALSCRIFTMNYPLILEHIVREAQDYIMLLRRLRTGRMQTDQEERVGMEAFWNENMGQHAEFIDGLLDPTEKTMKQTAREYALQFERLTRQALAAQRLPRALASLTGRSRAATEGIRHFKAQGTEGNPFLYSPLHHHPASE